MKWPRGMRGRNEEWVRRSVINDDALVSERYEKTSSWSSTGRARRGGRGRGRGVAVDRSGVWSVMPFSLYHRAHPEW